MLGGGPASSATRSSGAPSGFSFPNFDLTYGVGILGRMAQLF